MRRTLANVGCVLAVVAAALPACAGAPSSGSAPPSYEDYRGVLMGFVDDHGLVDYAGLRAQEWGIDDVVTSLGTLAPKVYDRWSEKDKIAFWINAYNALTLKAIIDHYPIDPATPNLSYPKNSIRQITGVWDQARVTVMGQQMTLGFIEAKILRRDFREPRIHVALVCAALSCPKLRNEPYEGAKLDEQLDDQARAFLADPRNLRIDRAGNRVRASEIFKWYADDFLPAPAKPGDAGDGEHRALAAFAAKYVSEADRAFLAGTAYRIEYATYDWTLNEQTH